MRTAKCTSCGAVVTLNATECYNCGNNIGREKKFVKWFIICFIAAIIYIEITEKKDEPQVNKNNIIKIGK